METKSEFDETQTVILDAVLECVKQYGFSGLTTRRIAELAAVNEVTIFRRFGNKTALLSAAFRREANFIAQHSATYTGDMEADLVRIVSGFIELGKRRGAFTPLILAELAHDQALREAVGAPIEVMAQLVAIIGRYQHESRLAPEPPMVTFATLIGPIVFALLTASLLPDALASIDPAAYVQRFLHGHQR